MNASVCLQADSVRSAIDKLSVLINHMEHLQSVMLASGWLTGRSSQCVRDENSIGDHSDTKSQVEDNSIEIVQLGDHVRVALQGKRDLSTLKKRSWQPCRLRSLRHEENAG